VRGWPVVAIAVSPLEDLVDRINGMNGEDNYDPEVDDPIRKVLGLSVPRDRADDIALKSNTPHISDREFQLYAEFRRTGGRGRSPLPPDKIPAWDLERKRRILLQLDETSPERRRQMAEGIRTHEAQIQARVARGHPIPVSRSPMPILALGG
jgi:hypothetical protein